MARETYDLVNGQKMYLEKPLSEVLTLSPEKQKALHEIFEWERDCMRDGSRIVLR